MTSQPTFRIRMTPVFARDVRVTVSMAILFALIALATQASIAQTYHVIYNFSGCADGAFPTSTLAIDRGGSLYGTTEAGGMSCGGNGSGVVFRLKRVGSGWLDTPLHSFTGGTTDGSVPANYGGLTLGPDGAWYGTTTAGGAASLGVVFRLRPPAHACATTLCPWTEDLVHCFAGNDDGSMPFSNIIFDAQGKMYGTTSEGGSDSGTVFGIIPSGSGWTESILYDVGGLPFAGLTIDHSGNLYGVNYEGGQGSGTVFELTPSGSGWTRTVLHTFSGGADGSNPLGGLLLDAAGNLFGSTIASGANGGGTIFELSPSGGGWTFNVIASLQGGAGPGSTLTLDAVGNLYGTTLTDGALGCGTVFRLSPSGQGWMYTSLHEFQCGNDGITPVGGVTLDASGNLYGTAAEGGASNGGLVWEITPN